jgi:agmatine deiminase
MKTLKSFSIQKVSLITLFISLTAFLFTSCEQHEELLSDKQEAKEHKPEKYYMPAEFEPLASIWLSSPTVDYKNDLSMLEVQTNMIKEILPTSTKIEYAVNKQTDAQALITMLLIKGVSQSAIDARITFHTVGHGDLWIRDTGGTFMKNKKGEYQVVDFDFDAYRMKPFLTEEAYQIYQLDNNVSYGTGAAKGATVVTSPLRFEGGNIHFNGKGTAIVLKKSLLASNPSMSLPQLEEELKRVFNLKKIIFLNENNGTDAHPVLESPLLVDGEYIFNLGVWHADELVSWVNPTTVLVPQVPVAELSTGNPYTQRAYQALEDAFQVLSASTDQDGRPLTVIRVPEPSPIVVELNSGDFMYNFLKSLIGLQHFPTDGSPIKFVLAASYMNYVVTNDLVLIPKFYKAGRDISLQQKDEAFKQLIQVQYPNRQVKQMDVDAITVGGGGMHCITQQVPSADKK